MQPAEARQIIESLANGVDPETGELLPSDGPHARPMVIRALFLAMRALESLEKREARQRSLPDSAGKAWSESEDDTLRAAFDAGTDIKELAASHGRTQGAIAARLVRLGRIAERADAYHRDAEPPSKGV